MGKAKRKINRLRRKLLKKKSWLRIPIAPPGYALKSDKDYDRKKLKKETKEMVNNND